MLFFNKLSRLVNLYNQDILRGVIFIFGMAVALYLGSREKLKSKQVLGILFILVIADLLQVAERYMDRDLFVSSRSARQAFVSSAADRTILQDKGHYRVYDSDAQLKSPRTAYFHHALGGYHGAKPDASKKFMIFSRNIVRNPY